MQASHAIVIGAVCMIPATIVLTLEAERVFDRVAVRVCRAIIAVLTPAEAARTTRWARTYRGR